MYVTFAFRSRSSDRYRQPVNARISAGSSSLFSGMYTTRQRTTAAEVNGMLPLVVHRFWLALEYSFLHLQNGERLGALPGVQLEVLKPEPVQYR